MTESTRKTTHQGICFSEMKNNANEKEQFSRCFFNLSTTKQGLCATPLRTLKKRFHINKNGINPI